MLRLPEHPLTPRLFLVCFSYSDALELVAKKGVNVKSIITHRFKLEETIQAFETSRTNKDAIKVMIKCD